MARFQKIIFKVSMAYLAFYLLAYILHLVTGAELVKNTINDFFQWGAYVGIPVVVLSTSFYIIDKDDTLSAAFGKIFATIFLAGASFFIVIVITPNVWGFCEGWRSESISLQNRNDITISIVERDYECSSSRYFIQRRYLNVFATYAEIDIQQIDRREWISVK